MNSIDTLIALANLRGSLDLRCQFQGDWALDHLPENLGVAYGEAPGRMRTR